MTADRGDVDDPAVAAAADDLADAIRAVAPRRRRDVLLGPRRRRRRCAAPTATGPSCSTTLEADGDDEEAAIEAIRDLADDAAGRHHASAVGGEDAADLDIATTIEGDLGGPS